VNIAQSNSASSKILLSGAARENSATLRSGKKVKCSSAPASPEAVLLLFAPSPLLIFAGAAAKLWPPAPQMALDTTKAIGNK